MMRFKILNLFSQKDGCSYVRHQIPFEELQRRGHHVTMKWPIYRSDYNIAILSRMVHEQFVETLVKMKMVGMKIVYDTDDLLFALEPENPFYSDAKSAHATQLTKRCMAFVDMVTASTPALAQEFQSKFTLGPVHVLPNCIRPKDWVLRPKEKRSTVRIGYAGACSHHRELNFLIPIIREIQKKHDVEFHIMGIFNSVEDLERNSKMKMKFKVKWFELFKETNKLLKTVKFVHHSYVPITEYPHRLAALDLDIGLCPLFESRFNRCKSAIKYYEYAMCGTAPIASDVAPYKECHEVLPMDSKLWREAILELVMDPVARAQVADDERNFVLENYDIEKKAVLWERAYHELLTPKPTILGADGKALKPGQKPGGIIHVS